MQLLPVLVSAALLCALAPCVAANIPLGSLHGHFTLAETEAWLNKTAAANASATRLFSIGSSHEHRPLWALCVGLECHEEESVAPQALYTALHHAREPMGLTALLLFIDSILYPSSPAAVASMLHLLSSRRLYFVLVVNPDGYKLNERGNGMQRKNTRPPPAGVVCPALPDGRDGDKQTGVDLNRNYPFCFHRDNQGSSTNACDIDYEGPGPFSEPETQAMKRFVEANRFAVAFNYHSFGKQVLIPYSCKPEGRTKDDGFIEHYAKRLTKDNGYPYGQAWRSNLYTVNGDASDWMYHDHGIFAVSPEVSPPDPVQSEHAGFWVSPQRVLGLASETLLMNLAGAWTAGVWLEASAAVFDSAQSTLRFNITNQGLRTSDGPVSALVLLGGSASGGDKVQGLGVLLEGRGQRALSASVAVRAKPAPGARILVWDASSCVSHVVVADSLELKAERHVQNCPESGFPPSARPPPGVVPPPNAGFRPMHEPAASAAGIVLLLFSICVALSVVAWLRLRRQRQTPAVKYGQHEDEEREGLV